METFYVYMFLRTNNSEHGKAGSPYYVGKGHKNRVISSNRKITRRPKDPANIVYYATDLTEWDAHQLEMLLIHSLGRIDLGTGCLRNRTDGGEGLRGHIPSAESRAKKSVWMKANPNRGNLVCPKWPKGKPRSEETKAKQSAAWTEEKRKSNSEKLKGNRNGIGNKASTGTKHTPERKARMLATRAATRLAKIQNSITL